MDPTPVTKIIDPSANVYTASAAILALALQGIATGAALPAEVPDDPSRLSAEQRDTSGITVLPNDIETVLDGLDSGPARSLLGDDIVDTTLAVRRHEQQNYAGRPVAEIAELFRLAWTV